MDSLLGMSPWGLGGLLVLLLVVLVIAVRPLRRALISAPLMKIVQRLKLLPPISDTEKAALDAGGAWIEAELFAGRPDFDKIMHESYPRLSPEEKAFLDGPVDELCRKVDNWAAFREGDLSTEVWDILKREGFFGLNIPKQYGGRGFSALAYSQVVMKLASRSAPLSITAMVPNSLGPAELLVHYGTQAQKEYYLPRLARGEEVPCFALTEPEAGSDAGSIQSEGVVFRNPAGEISIRLNLNKRYITLASIATVLGLAIKLRDPENILGRGEHLGITCLLVPAKTEGIRLGRRHDPMGVPFINCPVEGIDVVVGAECIIGGLAGAGKGWMMLMECLAAGRGLSLPASMTGGAKLVARTVGDYAAIRRQFGTPIGRFEGIMEKMALVGGLTYLLEALRVFTCGSVDAGKKSSVVSAIAKYSATEMSRKVINAGMDILGGAGISMGPRNLLAHHYIAAPVGITVEGANILTRSMIVFGNGAFRCHPYVYREMKAILANDLDGFDRAFWGHVGFVLGNGLRAIAYSLTRGHLAPGTHGVAFASYRRKLARASATFAVLSDMVIGLYAGTLKRREYLTGYFADVHAWMYLATCVLRRFHADGERREDAPFARWALDYAFNEIQVAFEGVFRNIRVPVIGTLLHWVVRPWTRVNPVGGAPRESWGTAVALAMQTQVSAREGLCGDIFLPKDPAEPLAKLERAFFLMQKSQGVQEKIRRAVSEKRLRRGPTARMLEEAVRLGILTPEEMGLVKEAETAVNDAIQVDEFREENFKERVPAASPTGLRAVG